MKINFSRNLAVLRKVHGITQEMMAEKCGVSRQAVTKWECGSSLPDLYKLSDIADILEVSVDELLHGSLIDKSEDQIDPDYAARIESKMDNILTEIKKKGCSTIEAYQEFKNNLCFDESDDIPAYILTNLGIREASEENYDEAINICELALGHGDIRAGAALFGIFQEMLDIYCTEEENDHESYQSLMQFAKKMQDYGKVLEFIAMENS